MTRRLQHRSQRSSRLGLLVLLGLLTASHEVRAQDVRERAAEAAFSDGVKLMKTARCAEALERFHESQRLSPASGTLLDIGYCERSLGHLASAWFAYRQAMALAETSHKEKHVALAQKATLELEPELPSLTLQVPTAAERSLSITLDGTPVERSTWSVAVPVDPGAHRVEAILESGERWQKDVTLSARESVTLTVPAAPARGGEPAQSSRAAVTPSEAPAVAPARTSPSRTWAYVTGGVGLATLAAASALFVSARLKYDGTHCNPQNQCDDADYQARKSAISRSHLSYALGAAGAVLTGVGVGLWMSSAAPAEAHSARLQLTTDTRGLAIAVRASW